MEALISLDDLDPGATARFGGKACALAALRRADLPVPDGFVVPREVFASALQEAGLGPSAEAVARGEGDPAALAERVRVMPVSRGRILAWEEAARALRGPLAVRSSAADEDGAERSFAGQHRSIVGVGPSGIVDAVRAVWASLYESQALAYRGRGPTPGAMAVLVQRVVPAASSGALFTVNPVTGSWREMVVEATFGLGESLMDGQVPPHWFLVRRPRRAPAPVQRVLSRVRLALSEEDLPTILWRLTASEAGLRREPVPDPAARTLTKEEVLRLCRLGLRVEALRSGPQDVEWAKDTEGRLFIVQARPITASGAVRGRRDVLWTRRFIGERFADLASPMGWSILEPLLSWFIAYPTVQQRFLGGGPALRLYRSRPYLNVTVFRHLLFKLPGMPPPAFLAECLPPEEEEAFRKRFAVLPDVAVYSAIFAETWREERWRRFRFNPLTNPTRWEEFEASLQTTLPALSREPRSLRDALDLARAQIAAVRDYIEVHVTSLLFANLTWQLLEGALSLWLPSDADRLMRALATCPPGNRTLEVNRALFALARAAAPGDLDALAGGALTRAAPPAAAPTASSGALTPGANGPRAALSPGFGAALTAFLAEYGHRSDASWELFAARWATDPGRLVPLLRASAEGRDPAARTAEQESAFAAASAEVDRALSLSPGRRLTLRGLIAYTRTYLLLRENQRFVFDRLMAALQRTLLWVGARLAAEARLPRAEDIALLSFDELDGLISGTLPDVSGIVARRAAERAADAAFEPPVFLRGDEGVAEAPRGTRLQGLGISAGRVSGRVRVVRSLAEGSALQPGEILVTRAVDPSWTPLFPVAAAVILELGSRLSHGAVVAREYGIPGVVNLDGVTRRLADGQQVTVDGTRGIVWVEE